MAQPLGVAMAAATIAVVADRVGLAAALWVPVVATSLAFVTVLVVVLDPPRPAATAALTANPYRTDRFLARVHGVSVLLVVPQFLVWTYALTWLVQERDCSPLRRERWSRPHTSWARWGGSPPDSSPTWSVPGCGRCGGWRWQPR